MLSEIVVLTKKILDEALDEQKILHSPKSVYEVYRALMSLINDISLVANHYLALDFTEEYLQNSSWGEPIDKWRRFFNEDLNKLNSSSKRYLHTLSYLCFEDADEGIMSSYYNCKTYYGFVRDEFNAGYVEPCGTMLYIKGLNTDIGVEERTHIGRFKKIDLKTYESREQLQAELRDKKKFLDQELARMKRYIKMRYTLDDLL